jgi:hypothetical protein
VNKVEDIVQSKVKALENTELNGAFNDRCPGYGFS